MKSHKHVFIIIVIWVAAAIPVPVTPTIQAQDSLTITAELLADFETTIEAGMETFNVPGAAVAVVQDGEIVYAQGFGVRNRETGAPFTPDTVFRVGSTTKSMTSLLIAMLVDEGVLDWDTLVIDLIPDFALPSAELTQSVRVRDLMGMGTGLGDATNVLDWDRLSVTDLIESLASAPVLAEPGELFHYNNDVYAVAGYLGPLAAGVPSGDLLPAYATLMQEHVFDPIGMATTAITDDPSTLSDNFSVSYGFFPLDGVDGIRAMPFSAINSLAPVGSTSSTARDMALYLITQLNGGVTPDGTRIVSAENLAETWQPQTTIVDTLAYGMGWLIEDYEGVQIIWHDGGIDGFRTEISMLPEANAGLVILTNTLAGQWFNLAVRYTFVDMLFGMETETPAPPDQLADAYRQTVAAFADVVDMYEADAITADVVAPYLGEYEMGWRVELFDDGTLWVLRPGHEFIVLPLEGAFYFGSGGPWMGVEVRFTAGDDGQIVMSLYAGERLIADARKTE
jgi:beta-lactamase class C